MQKKQTLKRPHSSEASGSEQKLTDWEYATVRRVGDAVHGVFAGTMEECVFFVVDDGRRDQEKFAVRPCSVLSQRARRSAIAARKRWDSRKA